MNKKLTGKAALVTGGSRGIGAAIARSLADDGADVAISYVSSPDKAKALVRELQEMGVRAGPSRPTRPSPPKSTSWSNKVAEHFGQLDILVNNAGVFISGPVGDVARCLRRTPVRDQCRRRDRRRSRGREAHDRGRPDHFHRLDGRRIIAMAGHFRLLGDQGGGGRVYTRLGTRPRTAGHHGQRGRAGSDRHRHESRGRQFATAQKAGTARDVWPGGGSRRDVAFLASKKPASSPAPASRWTAAIALRLRSAPLPALWRAKRCGGLRLALRSRVAAAA